MLRRASASEVHNYRMQLTPSVHPQPHAKPATTLATQLSASDRRQLEITSPASPTSAHPHFHTEHVGKLRVKIKWQAFNLQPLENRASMLGKVIHCSGYRKPSSGDHCFTTSSQAHFHTQQSASGTPSWTNSCHAPHDGDAFSTHHQYISSLPYCATMCRQ